MVFQTAIAVSLPKTKPHPHPKSMSAVFFQLLVNKTLIRRIQTACLERQIHKTLNQFIKSFIPLQFSNKLTTQECVTYFWSFFIMKLRPFTGRDCYL